MKLVKKALAGVAVAAALATSAQASVITIQGVSWDPDYYADATSQDFQATSDFKQWFQTGASFDPTGAGVVSFNSVAGLSGTYLTGAGLFNTVNGVNDNPANPIPETNPAIFAAGRELTYTFGGIKIVGATLNTDNSISFSFDLTQSYFNVYSDSSNDYNPATLAGQVNAANTDLGTPFLSGVFDAFGTDSAGLSIGFGGTKLVGGASGLISVTGGAAFGNFDTNTLFNPLNPNAAPSDLTFSGSSQTTLGDNISSVSTGEFQGNTIPEPASIALIGLAMLGAGVASRRKAAKK